LADQKGKWNAASIHFDCGSYQIDVTGYRTGYEAYDILPYRVLRLDQLRQI